MRTFTTAIIERTGRDCDAAELREQIGRMNILAISGGVWSGLRDSTNQDRIIGLWMPVTSSRAVEVSLDFDDTYRVRRVRRIVRGADRNAGVIEWERTGVYCDQVGEVAYSASCWR
jgi:hypothetical protein